MHDEAQLIARLRKIEALYANPGTDGERDAAADALERIRMRLREHEQTEGTVEMRFSLRDMWSRSLFVALLRRYGITPYRYRGQRYTTVMARVSRSFAEQFLWPEFCDLNETLREYLAEVTNRVVAEAISGNTAPVEERGNQLADERVHDVGS